MNKALKRSDPAISFFYLYYVGTYLSAERYVPFFVTGTALKMCFLHSYIPIGKKNADASVHISAARINVGKK